MKATIAAAEEVYKGWIRVSRVALRMPDGTEVERHVEEHGCAAAVLPYDPHRRCALLVSMPRAPVISVGEADLLEAIAGSLDGDEAEDCARREAMEEAGVRLGPLERLSTIWSMPSFSTERVTLFLAAYEEADRVGAGGGAAGEHENIIVHEMPLDLLWDLARGGELADMKTLLLLQSLYLRRPGLFEA